MRFEWDAIKSLDNKRKHRVSFEAARIAIQDPLAISKLDDRFSDERWITLGKVGQKVLYVAHTVRYEGAENQEVVRIISARQATSRERGLYADNP